MICLQGDGTNQKSKIGHPIFHEEIGFVQQQIVRSGTTDELQSLCLSEKGRYVVLIGRIKENATNLRAFHNCMKVEWDRVMDPEKSRFIWALSGDLKYMLTMLGHAGASCKYPCLCCVRSRQLLGFRSWITTELEQMQQRAPTAFKGDSQLRSYPADPTCNHDVQAGTCFCVDKGAEFIESFLRVNHEADLELFSCTNQAAPFHAAVMNLAQQNTYSIVAHPLLACISIGMRFAGNWHCPHNTRVMIWVMCKDAAGQYGVLPALQEALEEIGLKHIKVSSKYKPRKEVNMEAEIAAENRAAKNAIEEEEAKDGNRQRLSMDGKELVKVMINFPVVIAKMLAMVKPPETTKCERWAHIMLRALTAFNAGVAILAADMWLTNRASEMGAHFRDFADHIASIGKGCGLPYVSREYLAILPIHWLCEPDHLQQKAHDCYEAYGVAPGAMSDATTEMVSLCPIDCHDM